METLQEIDSQIVIWLNQALGRSFLVDQLNYLLVSDYFIPLLMAFWMIGLWLSGDDTSARERNQRAVFRAALALGLAALVVVLLNEYFIRDRPFTEYRLTNLLYWPSDRSSFPSNPAAVSFALAAGVWLGNRRVGVGMFFLAALWSFVRIANGLYYPSDVAAGAFIGVAAAGGAAVVLRFMEPLPTWVLKGVRFLNLA